MQSALSLVQICTRSLVLLLQQATTMTVKRNAGFFFSAPILPLLQTPASVTGILVHAAGMGLWCVAMVQSPIKGLENCRLLLFDTFSSSFCSSSSASAHLSQSDRHFADAAGMGLWCMATVQSRMWLARALME